MAKIKGICKNIGGDCNKALNKEIQEIEKTNKFVCEECGKELFPYEKGGTKNNKRWIIKAIGGLIALLGAAGIVTYHMFSNNNVDVDVINETLTITVNENQPLPENIISVIAEKQVEWKSSNPDIAIINNNVFIARSEGKATITATSLNKKDTLVICCVTVVPNELKPTPAINIVVEVPTITNGESTILSYSGGNGKTFKWYSGSCGGTLVGEGNNFKVSPNETTTYYGRWEDGNEVSECQQITVTVKRNQYSNTKVNSDNYTRPEGDYAPVRNPIDYKHKPDEAQ